MPRFLFASDSLKGTLSSAQTAELLAAAAGLPLVAPAERDVEAASTAGVGELVSDALDHGARDVTIALGGSTTNDGGMGRMRALGFRLLGAGREELAGRGGDLALVRAIDRSHADARLGRTSFTVMCDVDNPLLGPNGATRTFAPQKGADAARVERLERGMANYCRVLRRTARSRPASPPRAPGRACRAWPSWAPWSPAPCPRRASRRSSPPRAVP
ncbi:glycerate kinase [Parafannyhessea umbonata]|uniref:glycerate kinase n=1 Tax=Parafannyhessea umbonata TaxID=604330 RepID=UPI00359C5D51